MGNQAKTTNKVVDPTPVQVTQPVPVVTQPAGNADVAAKVTADPAGTGYLDTTSGKAKAKAVTPPPADAAAQEAARLADEARQAAAAAEAARLAEEARKAKEAADLLAKQEADRKAAEAAKAVQAVQDRAAAQAMMAELDDAVGIGTFNVKDQEAATRLLSGKSPQQMQMIRDEYFKSTGRSLEGDVSDQFGGVEGNQMMANVMQGMDLKAKLEHFDTSKSLMNTLDQATPEELNALVGRDPKDAGKPLDPSIIATLREDMSEDDLMKARLKLFKGDPAQEMAAVRERMASAKGFFSDDEGSVMTAFATLSMAQRQALLNEPATMEGLNDEEQARMREIATSESSALNARMIQATDGGGTDDDAVKSIVADAGRLNAEETGLKASLADPKTTPEARAAAEARLKELNGVNDLIKPQRNADGSLVEGSFLERLDSDVGDEEIEAQMKTMGLPQYEISKQSIFNAMDQWNDNESKVRESFAKLPVAEREKLFGEVEARLSSGGTFDGLDAEDLAKVKSFVVGDRKVMAEIRIDDADGLFGQDEAQVYGAMMDLTPEERTAVANTAVGQKAREMMDDGGELTAFDEVVRDGRLSVGTGSAAGTDGLFTNQAVLDLTYENKTNAEAHSLREGYVLSKQNTDPSTLTDAQRANLAMYQQSAAALDGDMDGDEYQAYLDKLVAHTSNQTDRYTGATKTGPTSAEEERASDSGRITGSQLTNLRATEKMGPDGEGGGGVASWFSDTDTTAQDSFQTQLAQYDRGMADGKVDEGEYDSHLSKGETFNADFQSMVDSQNKIKSYAATAVAAVVGLAAAIASGGALGPAALALVKAVGSLGVAAISGAAAIGTKELMGGARYDTFGEAGALDTAMILPALATSALGDKAVKALLPALADDAIMSGGRIVQENLIKTTVAGVSDTVTGTATNSKLYEGGDAVDNLSLLGDQAATTASNPEFWINNGLGFVNDGAKAGSQRYTANRAASTTTSTTTDPSATAVHEPTTSSEPVTTSEPVTVVEPVTAVEPVATSETSTAVDPVTSETVIAVDPVTTEPLTSSEPVSSTEPVTVVEPVTSTEPATVDPNSPVQQALALAEGNTPVVTDGPVPWVETTIAPAETTAATGFNEAAAPVAERLQASGIRPELLAATNNAGVEYLGMAQDGLALGDMNFVRDAIAASGLSEAAQLEVFEALTQTSQPR